MVERKRGWTQGQKANLNHSRLTLRLALLFQVLGTVLAYFVRLSRGSKFQGVSQLIIDVKRAFSPFQESANLLLLFANARASHASQIHECQLLLSDQENNYKNSSTNQLVTE